MESRHVRHFLAAYDRGTFAAAAAHLRLTQQAISKSVARLEATLGVRLFERDGRRLRPTRYADLFVPHARAIMAESERFRTGLVDLLGGGEGTLRIGVGPSAATDLVAAAASRFLRAHPNVRLHVSAGLFDDMSDDLVLGRLDLFVAIRQLDRTSPLIAEEPVREMRYLVLSGPAHPLAQDRAVGLEELAAADWIVGAALGDIERSVDASFAAAGVARPAATIETTSVLFALSLLRRGDHLMLLPESLATDDLAAGRLVTIGVQEAAGWTRPLVVARRTNAARVRFITDFIEAVGSTLA